MSASEAAAFIHHGDQIGVSGFTGSGYPKEVPLELARRITEAHARGEEFRISLFTGASTGPELDGVLAKTGGVQMRLPYQSDPELRRRINAGETEYIDLHLSEVAQLVDYGFLGKLDVAVIEVTSILGDGRLVPSFLCPLLAQLRIAPPAPPVAPPAPPVAPPLPPVVPPAVVAPPIAPPLPPVVPPAMVAPPVAPPVAVVPPVAPPAVVAPPATVAPPGTALPPEPTELLAVVPPTLVAPPATVAPPLAGLPPTLPPPAERPAVATTELELPPTPAADEVEPLLPAPPPPLFPASLEQAPARAALRIVMPSKTWLFLMVLPFRIS